MDILSDQLEEFFRACDASFAASLVTKIGKSFDFPDITNVIFHDPATIVLWSDGTKTVVKCQKENGDTYNKETGLAMAIVKKAYGNKGNFNDIFTKWLKDKE
jgi:hypothetical protein